MLPEKVLGSKAGLLLYVGQPQIDRKKEKPTKTGARF